MARSPLRSWLEFSCLLVIGGALVHGAVILPNRVRTAKLEAERDESQAERDALEAEVDRLAREIEALQSDPAYVERRIRKDLRYLRPGERVFKVEETLPSPSREPGRSGQ